MANTLRKAERLNRKKIIEKVFASGARSFSFFPLRVVYMPVEGTEAPVSIVVSVPKRRLRQAVKRNRVKRQIREAYRRNKHHLVETVEEKNLHLALIFIYLADGPSSSCRITERVRLALARIAEEIATKEAITTPQTSSEP